MKASSVFFILLFLSTSSWSMPARVLLIRHAEKPDFKSIHLSEKGYERANALSEIFEKKPELARFGLPSSLFALKYIPGSNTQRCIETLVPLAKKLNLAIQIPFENGQTPELAQLILTDPKYDGKTVMIAWVHSEIVSLTLALKAQPPVSQWNKTVFDHMWMIDYNSDGDSQLTVVHEDLLPGDDQ
jgi:hypothetical protein